MNTTANEPYAPLAVGDYVIVGPDEEYAGLVGRVTEIIRLGSPEHDTGNPTDDIVVDLSATPYSDYEKDEIIALAKELGYDDDVSLDDIPLDCVILAPDDLIRITAQEYELNLSELTSDMKSADELGEWLSSKHFNEMYNALIARVEQNNADFEKDWLKFGNRELLGMASRIHAVSDAYSYMTAYHSYSEDELRFYLQFQNPLDIVAEHWHERNIDLEDMSFAMDFLMEPARQRSALEIYALTEDKPTLISEQTVAEQYMEPVPLTPHEQLVEKLSGEYKAFLEGVIAMPTDKIIEASYEKVFKEDFVLAVENREFSEEEIAVMLSQDDLLETLYQDWLAADTGYMDLLRDCVDERVDMLVEETRREQAKSETTQAKSKPQIAQREPSLLDEVHEAAREIEAKKAAQPANPTKKHDRGIE